jgi:tRNA-2-methylthio-N6-dimethylallyladenosine synthase
MSKTVYIHTFGCQMNVHDSEKMVGVLKKEGYSQTDNLNEADLIIFNTCSIRQKAEQKFYSELGRIRAIKKERPEVRIAVAGCIAQQEGKALLKKNPYVDFVFGPQNIHVLKDINCFPPSKFFIEENPVIAEQDLPVNREDDLRAWVTIMYGCNNFCSYCVVPYTRGREKSRPSENIYREVSALAGRGFKEICLLGQNVNSYKSNIDFPGLLRKLNGIGGLERIRFVTSHPKDLSPELMITMEESAKVCEHIHLPLQSGSNSILRRMNRGYTYSDFLGKVVALRKAVPAISITSDIIAGFPGETEGDYLDTVRALKEIEFDGIFAFKYSQRPFTKAAGIQKQIEEHIKSERLDEILKLQDEITVRKNRSLEKSLQEVLVEGVSDTDKEKSSGRTRSNKIVNIAEKDISRGSIVKVEITKARKHSLDGRSVRQ